VCLREVMELRDSSDQDMSNGCLTGCSKQGEGFDFHPANAGRALQELYPDRFNLGFGVSNAAAKQPRGVRYEGPQPFIRLGFQDADFAGGGSDRLVDAIVAWGSVDALRERIAAHHAAGANHVCILPLRPDGDRTPDERVLEALAPR
jgi:hypothetical protein